MFCILRDNSDAAESFSSPTNISMTKEKRLAKLLLLLFFSDQFPKGQRPTHYDKLDPFKISYRTLKTA
jgi:hypothetical protein